MSLALRDNDSNAGTPGQTLLQPANLTDSIGCTTFSSGLHAEFTTGTHWRSSSERDGLYFREFNFDPFFSIVSFSITAPDFLRNPRIWSTDSRLPPATSMKLKTDSSVPSGPHSRRNNQAGFLDARWQPLARLTLNAGGRAEDNADFGTRVVPRAGASYALRIAQGAFGDTRLHATYGQGIVEPRFDQSSATIPAFPAILCCRPKRAARFTRESSRNLLPTACALARIILIAGFTTSLASNSHVAGVWRGAPFGAGTFFNTDLARARGANLSGEARITHWSAAAGITPTIRLARFPRRRIPPISIPTIFREAAC